FFKKPDMDTSAEIILVRERLAPLFDLPATIDKLDFINELANHINELILHDFPKLVNILYRIDVDETQLKDMLKKYEHDDAGYVIAQLIIDREKQKIESGKRPG